jgi:hypothetical protein
MANRTLPLNDDTPVTIPVRQRLAQIASIVGALAFTLGLIGWVWEGALGPVVLVLFVVGLVATVVWIVLAPREASGLFRGRGARFSTMTVLLTFALIAIVAIVYLQLQRAVLTLDMTQRQDYSLSPETVDLLEDVTRPIRITGFYSPRALASRELDDQIFRLYDTFTNGLVSREYIDPDQNPALAQTFQVSFDGDVFISYLNEDGSVDFNTLAPVFRETNTERDLTQALSRLLLSGRFKVYFETGYTNIDLLNEGQQGITGVLDGLGQYGVSVGAFDLLAAETSGQGVPEDADTLVIIRGDIDLSQAAIDILDAYLQQGGALLILSDVVFTRDPLLKQDGLFNQYLWDNYGVRALDVAVVDAIASGQTQLDVGSYAVFPDLEIGSRLNVEGDDNTTTLFRITRGLEVNTTPPVPNGQIIATSPQSYGETDWLPLATSNSFTYDPATDVNGPFAIVAWANNQNTGSKIILAGDADFITNGQVGSPQGNSILFTDAITWLTGYSESVSFTPQAFSTGLPLAFISTQTIDRIALFTQIFMPGAMLLAGIGVWTWRNRR